jgi:trk system potassium uptake protein TrkA
MKVMIAGGDPTGAQLASLLLEQSHEIVLIEHRKEVLARLHLELPTEVIYEDDATDIQVLEDAGIRDVDVLAACSSNDADNLVLCYLAHNRYHVPRTIGRINNPWHAWLFDEKLNVDVALNESTILAHLIGEEMSVGEMMTLLKLRRGPYSLVEVVIQPGVKAAGSSIKDLPLPEKCVIVAIIRKGEMIVPRGSSSIEIGDEVLAITDQAGGEELAALFTVNHTGAPASDRTSPAQD